MLRIERQRTERSKRPFLLVLLDISNLTASQSFKKNLGKDQIRIGFRFKRNGYPGLV